MKLRVKKLHKDAVIPSYAKDGDACFDLTCVTIHGHDNFIQYNTGLAFEIPEGHVGLIFPRSSITKKDMMLKNSVGVIDSGYRGEISFRFQLTDGENSERYVVGERVGQMMILPIPTMEFEEVDELSDSDRGEGGFGSTGK